ncbi:MAG TPA: hypothetical protein VN903_06230 [Polyangia bacterium]|nr:hypothetical protein [Polyangia bacterium]
MESESIYRLQKGRTIDRFWRAEFRDKVLTISEGDMWSPDTAERRVHRGSKAAVVMIDGQIDCGNRGYHQISAAEFKAAVRSWKGKKPPAKPAPLAPDEEKAAPIPLPSAHRRPPKKRRLPKRSGPFTRSRTGAAIHVLVFSPARKTSLSKPPRVTSGGRPIMAEGQRWPVCPYCERRLGLSTCSSTSRTASISRSPPAATSSSFTVPPARRSRSTPGAKATNG